MWNFKTRKIVIRVVAIVIAALFVGGALLSVVWF